MFFDTLEARRLMSVVNYGVTNFSITQSGSGTVTINETVAGGGGQVVVAERGSHIYNTNPGETVGNPDLIIQDQGSFGFAQVYGLSATKPVNISLHGHVNPNSATYDGTNHAGNINGGSGSDTIVLTDEGSQGSKVTAGGGSCYVNVQFSHKAVVTLGGGSDTVLVNQLFDASADSENAGSVAKSNSGQISSTGMASWGGGMIQYGNTSMDLITVTLGGGADNITDYAGNLKIQTGGGFDVLVSQSLITPTDITGTTDIKGTTDLVDVISQSGINQYQDIMALS